MSSNPPFGQTTPATLDRPGPMLSHAGGRRDRPASDALHKFILKNDAAEGAVVISDHGTRYVVTPDTCECTAFKLHGVCSHLWLYVAARESMAFSLAGWRENPLVAYTRRALTCEWQEAARLADADGLPRICRAIDGRGNEVGCGCAAVFRVSAYLSVGGYQHGVRCAGCGRPVCD